MVFALWRGQRGRGGGGGKSALDYDETEIGRRRGGFAELGDGLIDVVEDLVGVLLPVGEAGGGGGRVDGGNQGFEDVAGVRDGGSWERSIMSCRNDLQAAEHLVWSIEVS